MCDRRAATVADPSGRGGGWRGPQPSGWRRTSAIGWFVGALALLAAALFVGYRAVFTHFLWYDDEGYVMISVRGYLAGHSLFREVYTQYGPFFFFTRRAIYAALAVPVSHDVNRAIALGEWLAAAGLCGAVAARLTRSPWTGLVAGGIAFLHLEVFVKEPGHPQELCMILVVLALLLGTSTRRAAGLAGLGLVCAALATTKINVAVYLVLAILLSLVLAADGLPLQTAVLGLLGAAALALPVTVMRAGLGFPSTQAYAAIVTGGVAAALVAARDPARPRGFGGLDLLRFALPLALGVLAVLAVVRLEGTTWRDLADGLWFEPLRYAAVFKASPIPLGPEGLATGAVGFAASLLTLRPRRWASVLWWLKLAFGLGMIAAALAEYVTGAGHLLVSGAATRGNAVTVLTYGTPFLWIVLVPDGGSAAGFEARFGRLLLCLVAVMQALVAYPTFGTQAGCVTVLTLLGAVVALHDAASAVDADAPAGRAWRVVPLAPLVPLAIAFGLKAEFYGRLYADNPSLGLWGASRIHLSTFQVKTFRDLTSTLEQHADTFFTIMGFNSLYFWTQIDPPTYFNGTVWPWMLSPAQQRAIVDVLAHHERAMVVVNNVSLGYLWDRKKVDPNGPLGAFIAEEFEPFGTVANYEVLTRRGRRWPRDPS